MNIVFISNIALHLCHCRIWLPFCSTSYLVDRELKQGKTGEKLYPRLDTLASAIQATCIPCFYIYPPDRRLPRVGELSGRHEYGPRSPQHHTVHD